MRIWIAGTGLVSVLGRGWPREAGPGQVLTELVGDGQWPVYRVPREAVGDVEGHARLRRSGLISLYSVGAATDAVRNLPDGSLRDTKLFFATTDGGIIHTVRFYSRVVQGGCGAGSPLIFPETVYNAPASHVASILGMRGEAVTLVGDSSVGLGGVCAACELIADGRTETALVVAANECDAVACAAYGHHGICAQRVGSGLPIMSEGAAAVVLSGQRLGAGGGWRVESWCEWVPVRRKSEARGALEGILARLGYGGGPLFAHVTWRCAPWDELPGICGLPGEGLAFTDLAQVFAHDCDKVGRGEFCLVSLGYHGQCAGLRMRWEGD